MKVSVFVGTSLDGFLARPDGTFDFLPVEGGGPQGFEQFLESVDAVVMGRNTFEVVLPQRPWPYGRKRMIVLSHHPVTTPVIEGVTVEWMAGNPQEIVERLESSGVRHIYVDGGITIQQFLCAGLVNSITITRVPVLIGEGIPLFGTVPHDIRLRHIGTTQYETGLVKSAYEVLRSFPS